MNTKTGGPRSPPRRPITDHLSFLINQHLEQMRNSSRVVLVGFDEEAYLAPQRMKKGEGDPMKRFQFNQVASDATASNRPLNDVRHPRCVVGVGKQ